MRHAFVLLKKLNLIFVSHRYAWHIRFYSVNALIILVPVIFLFKG